MYVQSTDYTVELNNFLQSRYRSTNILSWDYNIWGPNHKRHWTAIASSAFRVLFWFKYGLTLCWQLMVLNTVVVKLIREGLQETRLLDRYLLHLVILLEVAWRDVMNEQ
jgi:hypothetical protein